MKRLKKQLIANHAIHYRTDNLDVLMNLKKNNQTIMDLFDQEINKQHYFEKQKTIINEICTINKRERYKIMARKCIPSEKFLTRSQIDRITLAVKEGVHLSAIHEKAFSTDKFPIKVKYWCKKYNNDTKKMEDSFFISEKKYEKNHLFLSGGAVRDILFLKEGFIKDLDFCMSFTEGNEHYSDIPYKNHIHPDSIFRMINDKELSNEHQKCPEYIKILSQIKDSITNMNDVEKTNVLNSFEFSFFVRYHFNQQEISTEAIYIGVHDEALIGRIGWANYVNENLAATIKTHGVSGIPIDILVADSYIQRVINSFDFAICKSSVDFTKAYEYFKNKELTEENCIKFFFQRLNVPFTVLRDVYHKELTISKDYVYRMDKILFFIDKHYPRLKAKFPDSEINLELSIEDPKIWEVKQIVKQREALQSVMHKVDFKTDNTTYEEQETNLDFKI